MARRLESLFTGGATLVEGLASTVSRKVGAIEAASRAAADPIASGMPLPTGYGLQVRGPAGERIVLPVCLPPGFDLESMVLRPEFLPQASGAKTIAERAAAREQQARERVIERAEARIADPLETPSQRLSGMLQFMFADSPGYTVGEGTPAPAPAHASNAERVEHLV